MVPRPKDLTNDERNLCVQFILQDSSNGKPKRGRLLEAQLKFNISRSTVSRLWRTARDQQAQGLAIHIVSQKMGRKRDHNMQPNYNTLRAMDVSERGSYRSMVKKMGVSRATLQRWGKAGLFKIFASYIKPSLTADNKFLRLRFSLEYLELDRVMNTLRYSSMHNVVHIDEKWFFITKGKNRYMEVFDLSYFKIHHWSFWAETLTFFLTYYIYYLALGEKKPYRACKSKRFIGKIMFLCAVSRPILRDDGTVLFDGKIGCFSFTTQQRAL